MVGLLRVDGIDISHHQNGKINFATARTAGMKFVYHKATEGGSFRDANYATRRIECAKADIPFGAYHFAHPETGDAVTEADFFCSVARPVAGDMVPVLDLEINPAKLSQEALTKWVSTWLHRVRAKTGITPMIYTPFDFPDDFLKDNFGTKLWVARYSPINTAPRIPSPWKSWDLRQFSDGVNGHPNKLKGVGNVDLNTLQGSTETVQSLRIPATKLGPNIKAASWVIPPGRQVRSLARVFGDLLNNSVSIFTLQRVDKRGLQALDEARLAHRNVAGSIVAWNPRAWRYVSQTVLRTKSSYVTVGENLQRVTMNAVILQSTRTNQYIGVVSYDIPPSADRKKRMVVLKEAAILWKEFASKHDIVLMGGADYVDEELANPKQFTFLSKKNTGLARAPIPLPKPAFKAEDFRFKGLDAKAGTSEKPYPKLRAVHVRTFSLPTADNKFSAVSTGQFRVVTQNIKGFPLMPQSDVVEDVRLTSHQAGIIGWQEMGAARYKKAIKDLGPKWDHAHLDQDNPISWRSKYWKKIDEGSILLHKGESRISVTRRLTWVILEHKNTKIRIVVCNAHFVAGAWAPGTVPQRTRRRLLWAQDQAVVLRMAHKWEAQGLAVIGLGDYNNKNSRELSVGARINDTRVKYHVPPKSIDQLWTLDGEDTHFLVGEKETLLGRNSDHRGRRVVVALSKPLVRSTAA